MNPTRTRHLDQDGFALALRKNERERLSRGLRSVVMVKRRTKSTERRKEQECRKENEQTEKGTKENDKKQQ